MQLVEYLYSRTYSNDGEKSFHMVKKSNEAEGRAYVCH